MNGVAPETLRLSVQSEWSRVPQSDEGVHIPAARTAACAPHEASPRAQTSAPIVIGAMDVGVATEVLVSGVASHHATKTPNTAAKTAGMNSDHMATDRKIRRLPVSTDSGASSRPKRRNSAIALVPAAKPITPTPTSDISRTHVVAVTSFPVSDRSPKGRTDAFIARDRPAIP